MLRFGKLLRRRTPLSLEDSKGSRAYVVAKPTLRGYRTSLKRFGKLMISRTSLSLKDSKGSSASVFGKILRRKTSQSLEDSTRSSASALPKPTLRRCKTDDTVNTTCSLEQSRVDKPSVSFGSIEIREHGRVLLDHPSCADGLALGLDWKHSKKSTVMKVNEYEIKRAIEGKRSNKRVQVLSSYDKSLLLMKIGGYKEKELTGAFRTIIKRDKEKELADAFLSMLKQKKKVPAAA